MVVEREGSCNSSWLQYISRQGVLIIQRPPLLAVMGSDRMATKAVPFESYQRAHHFDVLFIAIAILHREIEEITDA